MNDITAVVLTKDEEAYIADCLQSLQWCDQVIVLDSLSSDRTVEIARQHGAQVAQRPFTNFADQRNAGIELVESEWVLFVDADERVSPELAAEILTMLDNQDYAGFWIPTHNYQMGKLILHAGFYPDYHLRLFRKEKGAYDPSQKVHEKVILDGDAGYLINPLIHLSCNTWSEFTDHQKHWAQLKAEVAYERGVKPWPHIVAGPILEFWRRYVRLQGYRDGWHGLRLSGIFAYYLFVTYVNLYKLQRTQFRAGKS
ncbi:MAG: glycosyltransferase family 2 protein [Anaerolineales bacterium]|nr:glycosyltransferase family 2 protein [Anaerolineales bacterium]